MSEETERVEETIEIERRFCGPPQSGNGGYVAGRLAAHVDGEVVAVRLHSPPPLGTPLSVRFSERAVDLCAGEAKVASARSSELELNVPTPPSFEEATRAAKQFRGFDEHVFPGCFVCGTERAEGDGLRIFPGSTGEGPVFAAPWVPDASLCDDENENEVARPFIWAALDCPGAFSFPQPEGQVILLGEMTAWLEGPVHVGDRCVLVSWEVEREGRRHLTGSALFGPEGECRGRALGLWFEVDPSSVPDA